MMIYKSGNNNRLYLWDIYVSYIYICGGMHVCTNACSFSMASHIAGPEGLNLGYKGNSDKDVT